MSVTGLQVFMAWTGMDDEDIAGVVYSSFPDTYQFERIATNLTNDGDEDYEDGFVDGVESVCETFSELDITLEGGSEEAEQGFETAIHFVDAFLFHSVRVANKVCSE